MMRIDARSGSPLGASDLRGGIDSLLALVLRPLRINVSKLGGAGRAANGD